MITREEIEASARAGVGVVESEGLRLARVLDRFYLALVDGDQSVCPHLENDGFWESWVTKWVVENVRPGDTFIDIGANTGYYAFFAASLGADAYAFEPNPAYFEALGVSNRYNYQMDRLAVSLHPFAISDSPGFATLSVPASLHGSASIRENSIGEEWRPSFVTVPTTTLDSMLFLPGRMVIKLDVEGAEEMAWRGMQKTLAHYKPLIALEWTPGAYSAGFFEELQAYGTVSWITYGGNEEPITKEWLQSQTDWVMLVVRP